MTETEDLDSQNKWVDYALWLVLTVCLYGLFMVIMNVLSGNDDLYWWTHLVGLAAANYVTWNLFRGKPKLVGGK